jgi:prepilin signal peptidase PulO-like enzyme (type II secretory pathway)
MFGFALKYGAVAGAIIISVLVAGIVLSREHANGHFLSSVWLGYLVMIVALSMIFLAVRDYRNRRLGGVIRFLPAFGMGLLVAGVAAVVYVAGWEMYLAATHYTFMDNYVANAIEAKRTAGMGGAELDAFVAQMEEMKVSYRNPLMRMPMTFLEIFPVGLVIALISAGILRNPRVLPARAG